jgi:hypothetical protein
MGFISSLFASAPKTNAVAAVAPVEEEKRKAKATRSSLLETSGGVMGQEVAAGETAKRTTLFGN